MAQLTGSFTAETSYGSYFLVEWRQTKYITEYYSIVNYDVYYCSDVTVSNQIVSSMSIGCTPLTSSATTNTISGINSVISAGQKRHIYSGTSQRITHSAGTLHQCRFTLQSSHLVRTAYRTITLDPILDTGTGGSSTSGRAYITSFPSFNIDSLISVHYANPMYSTIKSLTLAIMWDNEGGLIYGQSLPTNKSTGVHTFELTEAQKNSIKNAAANSNSIEISATLITEYDSGETFNHTATATCKITEHPPEFNITLVDTHEDALNITQNEEVIILGLNKVQYTVAATPYNNATIVSIEVTNGGKRYHGSSGLIENTLDPIFYVTVTDSRGLTTQGSVTMMYVEYKNLTCNIAVDRSSYEEGDYSIPFVINGQFYNDYIGNTRNSLSVTYRYKYSDGSFTNWYTLTPKITGDSYTAQVSLVVDYPNSVYIEVGVGDVVDYIVRGTSSSVTPIFEWGVNDFKFNVPVSINDAEVITLVKEGTSGIWTYRKWSDGLAECWGNLTISATIGNATAGWYSSGELSGTNLSFPFTFKERPTVTVSVMPTGQTWAVLFPSNTSGSTTQTGSYQLMSTSNFTSKSYVISYVVKGKWE